MPLAPYLEILYHIFASALSLYLSKSLASELIMILMETCPSNIDTEQVHSDLIDIQGVDSLSYLVVGQMNFDYTYLLGHIKIIRPVD